MDSVFTAFDWLQLIALGGVVGALGQGMRMVAGFKKLHDASSGSSVAMSDLIVTHRLLVPLGIGFIAGALAAASTISSLDQISGQQILGIAAAGYAGADFIEGFMSRVAPAADVAAGEEGVGIAAAPAAAQPVVAVPGTASAAEDDDEAVG
jgi:hypothetical protein